MTRKDLLELPMPAWLEEATPDGVNFIRIDGVRGGRQGEVEGHMLFDIHFPSGKFSPIRYVEEEPSWELISPRKLSPVKDWGEYKDDFFEELFAGQVQKW